MNSEIVVGSLSLVGTLLGSGLGVLASAKLTNYRIAQLEKKVDKHNNFAARLPVVEEQIKVSCHRISDLEEKYERIVLK
jgi:ABC-type lipoprotein release transport system permease subunit